MKTVIISGYFDPLHVGHLDYMENALRHGDRLFVIVNNDMQAILKKEKEFMPFIERVRVVNNLSNVDSVIKSIDQDLTVRETLKLIRKNYPENEFVFFNEGDRQSCPEEKVCKENNIKLIFGKGEKVQSSSWLTK